MKTVVSLGLGNVDRAGRRGCGPDPNIVVRPLQREIPCPLGLMERINKQNNPALDIVRGALLELRAGI